MSSANIEPKAFLGKHQDLEIDKLFRTVIKLEGSDLHLKVDLPPHVRVNGILRPLNRGPVDDEEMVRLIFPMIGMQERRKRIFEEDGGSTSPTCSSSKERNGGSASTSCSS